MDAATQILVEPGNPFGFDSEEFADLVDGVREDLGAAYDVRVAYREQVGAASGTVFTIVRSALAASRSCGARANHTKFTDGARSPTAPSPENTDLP